MLYLLHHSKGTLILSANDRQQVVAWSKRQLGQAVNRSVTESDFSDIESAVERSGTGVKANSLQGCKPMLSPMANSATSITKWRKDNAWDLESSNDFNIVTRVAVWHWSLSQGRLWGQGCLCNVQEEMKSWLADCTKKNKVSLGRMPLWSKEAQLCLLIRFYLLNRVCGSDM